MKKKSKTKSTLLPILMTFAIYLGAVLIYFYANGWRVNPFEQTVTKTGALSIESTPSNTDIFIDEKEEGRSPKSISLGIGKHLITVSKEGYISWSKEIQVYEEKLTPLEPWLIKSERKEVEIFNEEEELLQSWIDEEDNKLVFLTITSEEILIEGNTTTINTYSLWAYDINRAFWDLSDNPYLLFSIDTEEILTFGLNLSHDSHLAILSITDENTTSEYLLSTTSPTIYEDLESIALSQFHNYKLSWAKNNKFLILESDADLISYDISKNTTHLLFKKTEGTTYIWTTDSKGYFYTLEENSPQENLTDRVYDYQLIQQDLDGGNKKTILSNIYFQKDNTYLEQYQNERLELQECLCNPFTNSPESTQTAGNIQKMDIHQDAKGMYLETEHASYWYNLDTNKFLLISPYLSTFLDYSPNNKMLMYKDQEGTHIFTFSKEDADHTVNIGSKDIANIVDVSNIKWLSNSDYIQYLNDNTMYISDKDGENQIKLIENTEEVLNTIFTKSLDKFLTLEGIEDENGSKTTVIKAFPLQ